MKLTAAALIASLGAIFTSANNAEVRQTVYAQVTKVEPQYTEPSVPLPEICTAPKPHPSAGLSAMLEWELARCTQAPRSLKHYRVYYQWDGRTYSRLTTSLPGESIPLRISIREATLTSSIDNGED